jgi:acetylornithine deacetylase/succinyl-diaminopimelate desuccinylase-like protein
MATTGVLRLEPGIPTAVAGEAELVADLRHPDAGELAAMLAEVRAIVADAAEARECRSEADLIWRIDPIPFDGGLVSEARAACAQVSGNDRPLTSGALHDAAEVARALPAAMVFCPSIDGLSHAREENTSDEDLAAGIEAFGLLANRLLANSDLLA